MTKARPSVGRSQPPVHSPLATLAPESDVRVAASSAAPRLSSSPPTDVELVAASLRGERAADEQLYRRHVRVVAGVAVRLLGHTADADDVIQDSFVTAFERLRQLRDAATFRPWLVRIAVRHAHRRFRRRRLLRWLGLDRTEVEAGLAQQAAPGLDAEGRTELAHVDRALMRLSATQRLAWILRHVEGYELTAVADACGVSLATVKRHLAVAQQAVNAHAHGSEP